MIWLYPRQVGIGTGIMLCLSATQFDGSDVPEIVQILIIVELECIKANFYARLPGMHHGDTDVIFVAP